MTGNPNPRFGRNVFWILPDKSQRPAPLMPDGLLFNWWSCQLGGMKSDIEIFNISRYVGSDNFTVCYRQGLESGHRRMSNYASESTNTAPLLYRAWAYQERILARRVLHLHMEGMFWECKTCSLCKCSYLGWEVALNDTGKRSSMGDKLKWKRMIAQAVEEFVLVEDVYRIWLDIVEEYYMLTITKESDSLPALSY